MSKMMKMLTDSLVALGVMVAVYFAVTPLVEGCAKTLRWRSWTSEVHIFWAQTMIVNTVSAVTSVWLAVALSDLYATKELSGIQLSMTTNFISSLVFAFGSFTSASYSWILNLCFYWSRYTVMQGLEDYSKGYFSHSVINLA
ncbi:hypothetical protein WR25_05922 [Diploscapter pachys]|uniref:Uncharacterized protein n=1 Tax=Diploscapter pachys TaxID=2018661 RepID=A0A2A2KVF6_9BILA|nr:hypothetical protein WR25_05922 [Diploscapter pachys]